MAISLFSHYSLKRFPLPAIVKPSPMILHTPAKRSYPPSVLIFRSSAKWFQITLKVLIIRRTYLNGENKKAIVTRLIRNPRDLAIDPSNHYIYWTDMERDGIFRVSLAIVLFEVVSRFRNWRQRAIKGV